VTNDTLPTSTGIHLTILRAGTEAFHADTTLAELKRRPEELVEYLYREASFPNGCFLLTGTGIVPPDSFTLLPGDRVEIAIDGIGLLANTVEQLS
jgi:2-dehydro-3-deoxy-D-arabinonate dehydratase